MICILPLPAGSVFYVAAKGRRRSQERNLVRYNIDILFPCHGHAGRSRSGCVRCRSCMRHGAKTIALHLTIDCRRRAMLGLWRTVWTYIQTIYLYITRSAPAVRLQQTGCKFCAGGSEEFLAEMVRWVGQVTIPESRNLPPPLLRELSDIHPWTTTTHPCVQHIHTYIHAYIYTYIHTYIHTCLPLPNLA